MKKTLVSGVKPTGNIHIGNYFGAMKKFVELQDSYESFLFIADYHALNQMQNPKELSKSILELAKAYLAIGLNPDKITLFKQSEVPAHTELCWILNSITPLSLLKRAHGYKDAKNRKKGVNMGLFNYPVLMAADILIYLADVVPVGEDQKQHLEFARKIAKLFNSTYKKDIFKLPQPLIDRETAVVPGIDGRKMSKSYQNSIGLFDSEEETRKKCMSIVTDSKKVGEPLDPQTCNIFSLHKLFSQKELPSLEKRYRKGEITYKESKELLAENINKQLKTIRKKKKELDKNPKEAVDALEKGRKKATFATEGTMAKVKKAIGVVT